MLPVENLAAKGLIPAAVSLGHEALEIATLPEVRGDEKCMGKRIDSAHVCVKEVDRI